MRLSFNALSDTHAGTLIFAHHRCGPPGCRRRPAAWLNRTCNRLLGQTANKMSLAVGIVTGNVPVSDFRDRHPRDSRSSCASEWKEFELGLWKCFKRALPALASMPHR
jgi:hypothetical protein